MGITQGILRQLGCDVFIETGTRHGRGVYVALQSGAKRVVTIDNDRRCWERVRDKYLDDARVEAVFGDSRTWLPRIMGGLFRPAVVWLDAHAIVPLFTDDNCAVRGELVRLAQLSFTEHHILIDDLDVFQRPGSGITQSDLETGLRCVNPAYHVYVVHGDRCPILAGSMRDDLVGECAGPATVVDRRRTVPVL